MKILASNDIGKIKEIIHADFPDFVIGNIKLINNGWDNLVAEINEEYIFRFLKESSQDTVMGFEKSFLREIELLKLLQNKITLAIPDIEFIGKSYIYMGYKKIPGNDLTRDIYDCLNNKEKNELHFDLANFLWEMHNAVTLEEAQKMGLRKKVPQEYLNTIEEKVLGHIIDKKLSSFIKETCDEYEVMMRKEQKLVFLYNDLHNENLAFDIENKKLNGIFDFSDLRIGDIHSDFQKLYIFDIRLMEEVVKIYVNLSGKKLDPRQIIISARIHEIYILNFFINKPDSKVYKDIMKYIEAWHWNTN